MHGVLFSIHRESNEHELVHVIYSHETMHCNRSFKCQRVFQKVDVVLLLLSGSGLFVYDDLVRTGFSS